MKILKILETVKNFIKKNKKLVTVVSAMFCAVVLVAGSIAGTIAYLTSKDSITNTFTVGNIKITLSETDVDIYGVKDGVERVKANDYKLIPGHEYIKDPTVYVEAKSEKCYLFVKVEDGLADIQDATTIAAQITNNGWEALGVDNVYYMIVDASNSDDDIEKVVFSNFKIKSNADVATYDGKTINVTAYAMQFDGFNDTSKSEQVNAKAAWDAANFS